MYSWMEERNGQHSGNIVADFIQITKDHPSWAKGSFLLGRYYNRLYQSERARLKEGKVNPDGKSKDMSSTLANLAFLVCKQYGKSLAFGTKYLYQTMARMLTVWLDLGEAAVKLNPNSDGHNEVEKIWEKARQTNFIITKLMQKLPPYQFLTAIPQLVSRISHPNPEVHRVIELLISTVLVVFPQQTLWHLVAVAKSTVDGRANRVQSIFRKVQSDPVALQKDPSILHRFKLAQSLADSLIDLCNHKVAREITSISMSRDFRKLQKLVTGTPCSMIIPLEQSLNAELPSVSSGNHKPFHADLPQIIDFGEKIDVLSSLQRPKKIFMVGSDGVSYPFLCKPDDDLRKDSRLMEFNAIVNKLLKKDPDARKRNLNIRTYAVVPLNEKCGLIEWVDKMNAYRNIISKVYRSKNMITSVRNSN